MLRQVGPAAGLEDRGHVGAADLTNRTRLRKSLSGEHHGLARQRDARMGRKNRMRMPWVILLSSLASRPLLYRTPRTSSRWNGKVCTCTLPVRFTGVDLHVASCIAVLELVPVALQIVRNRRLTRFRGVAIYDHHLNLFSLGIFNFIEYPILLG